MMEAAEKRRMRGWILQHLARSTSSSGELFFMERNLLFGCVKRSGMQPSQLDFDRELRYLAGKGYLEVEQFKGKAAAIIGGEGIMSARLLPAGQDLVDRTTQDAGVDLGPEFG